MLHRLIVCLSVGQHARVKKVLFMLHNEGRSISCESLIFLIVYLICYLKVLCFQNTLKSDKCENVEAKVEHIVGKGDIFPLFIMLYNINASAVVRMC